MSSLAEELRQKFAKNLKFFREKAGLTQVQLAEELDINPRYVQQLEGKNVPNVRLDTIEQLAKKLGIHPSALLK
jgi:transcriptional regulator with XRE-family HTH domain